MKKIKILLAFTIIASLWLSCTKEIEEIIKKQTNTHSSDSLNVVNKGDSVKIDTVRVDSVIVAPVKVDSIVISPVNGDTTIVNINPQGQSGTGTIVSKTIAVSNFTEVEAKSIGIVEIKYGAEYKVEVSDYQNIIDNAKVYLQGERLIISYAENVSVMGSKLKVTITMPNKLSKAIVSGSGSISISSGFAPSGINLTLSGAGNISASGVAVENVNIVHTGAGSIDAAGTVNKLTIASSGSGSIRCKDLISNDADCDISGASAVFVNAKNNLKVKGMGVGSLTYYGNPALNVNKGFLFILTKG